VLENPNHISKNILARGLDAGTAYEILSIDIADVNVGENIGAKLQIESRRVYRRAVCVSRRAESSVRHRRDPGNA
jgi:uncharacterized protein YqfA (UPF0365 family)